MLSPTGPWFNVLHLVYSPAKNYFSVWCEIGLKIYFFPCEYLIDIFGKPEAAESWLLQELCSSNNSGEAKSPSHGLDSHGCPPFGICGPQWKKKSCLGLHIKYTNTNEN